MRGVAGDALTGEDRLAFDGEARLRGEPSSVGLSSRAPEPPGVYSSSSEAATVRRLRLGVVGAEDIVVRLRA